MAKDAANDLSYFLLLDEKYRDYLGSVRHWEQPKVGFDEQQIWLKDLDYAQVCSVEVQTLPSKKIYTEKDGKLFPLGSLLPEGRVPSVMWTPISRAFPVSKPALNHHYFGISESIEVRLVPSANEQEAVASLFSLNQLENYLQSASSARLKSLKWTLLDRRYALVLGTPLLSLTGTAYWKAGRSLFPAGFQLELEVLNEELFTMTGAEPTDLILWDVSGNYTLLKANCWEQLSLSSVRLTNENKRN